MRARSQRLLLTAVLATMSVMLLTANVMAQDAATAAPATPKTTSWFSQFLYTSDPIGLVNIWVLVLFSVVAMGLTIKFALMARKINITPQESFNQIDTMLNEKRYREAIDFANADPSFLGKVVSGAMAEASNGYSAMERALEETADAEITRLLRPLEYLNILGNISPMLGLFGTVYGMILAFQQLVSSGGKPDPAALAAGISTALVTTFWGLIVAIPALAAYALIRNKIDESTSEGILMVEDLIRPFKPGGKKSSSSSSKQQATPKPQATPQA
ncbi:MAG: MotA/TolQ/ExbB proton channel family protein [Phycisphaera sp.]|nr:MotA/TolQ/ExbB proton channel family protein [Phycisphaera sp.]